MSRRQYLIFFMGLGFLLAGILTFAFTRDAKTVPVALEPEKIVASDYTLGDPNAKVTVIEYASPSCTACAWWNTNVFPRFKQDYIDTGMVLYVYRFYPLTRFPSDPDVAKLAMCLPRDQFFTFIDMMYRNQPLWDKAEYVDVPDAEGALVQMGHIAGLSDEQIAQCRAPNAQVDQQINQTAQHGKDKYNISGTPTFVVNNVLGPADHIMTFEDLQQAVASASAAATEVKSFMP